MNPTIPASLAQSLFNATTSAVKTLRRDAAGARSPSVTRTTTTVDVRASSPARSDLDTAEMDEEAQRLRRRTTELIEAANNLRSSIREIGGHAGTPPSAVPAHVTVVSENVASRAGSNRPRTGRSGTNTRGEILVEETIETTVEPSPRRAVYSNPSAIFGAGITTTKATARPSSSKDRANQQQIAALLQQVETQREQLAELLRSREAHRHGSSESRQVRELQEQLSQQRDETQRLEDRNRRMHTEVVRLQEQARTRQPQGSDREAFRALRAVLLEWLDSESSRLAQLLSRCRAEAPGAPAWKAVARLEHRVDTLRSELASARSSTILDRVPELLDHLHNTIDALSTSLREALKAERRPAKPSKVEAELRAQITRLEREKDNAERQTQTVERRLEQLLVDLPRAAAKARERSRSAVAGTQEGLLEEIDRLISNNQDLQHANAQLQRQYDDAHAERLQLQALVNGTRSSADTIQQLSKQAEDQARAESRQERQRLLQRIHELQDKLEEERLSVHKRNQVINVLREELAAGHSRPASGSTPHSPTRNGRNHRTAPHSVDDAVNLVQNASDDSDGAFNADESTRNAAGELRRLAQTATADRDLRILLNKASDRLQTETDRSALLEKRTVELQETLATRDADLLQLGRTAKRLAGHLAAYEVQFAKITSVGASPANLPADILNVIREHGGDPALAQLLSTAVTATAVERPSANDDQPAGETTHPLNFVQHYLRVHALYSAASHTLQRLQQKHAEASQQLQSQRIQIDAVASDAELRTKQLLQVEHDAKRTHDSLRHKLEQFSRDAHARQQALETDLARQASDAENLRKVNADLARKIRQIVVGYQNTFCSDSAT